MATQKTSWVDGARVATQDARAFERRGREANHPYHVVDYTRAANEQWVWALVALMGAR